MTRYFIPRDNSKCFNEVCPVRTNCLRYMAETNKYQTVSLFEFALEYGCEGYTIIIDSDKRD